MAAKEKDYRDKFLALQKMLGDYQKDIATKEGEMTRTIVGKLKQVTAQIGQAEGFTMVFEKSQDTLVYAQGAEDLTTKVIGRYNGGK